MEEFPWLDSGFVLWQKVFSSLSFLALNLVIWEISFFPSLSEASVGELGHIRPLQSFSGFLHAGADSRKQWFLIIAHS